MGQPKTARKLQQAKRPHGYASLGLRYAALVPFMVLKPISPAGALRAHPLAPHTHASLSLSLFSGGC